MGMQLAIRTIDQTARVDREREEKYLDG